MTSIYLLDLSTRGGWVVEKVQNSVYVVIECPLKHIEGNAQCFNYFIFQYVENNYGKAFKAILKKESKELLVVKMQTLENGHGWFNSKCLIFQIVLEHC